LALPVRILLDIALDETFSGFIRLSAGLAATNPNGLS
jgi:hypothetical protein